MLRQRTTRAAAAGGGDAATKVCEAGKRRCKEGSAIAYEECLADGSDWQLKVCPGAKDVCKDGACVQAACGPKTAYCEAAKAMLCKEDGSGGELTADCGGQGKACKAGKCVEAACKPGSTGCQGNAVAVCNAAGTEQKVTACAAGTLCNKGVCIKGVCVPFATKCDGDKVLQCAVDASKWSVVACAPGHKCKGGQCVQTSGQCTVPKTWTKDAQVLKSMDLPKSSMGACDLDGDGQPDNAMGAALSAFSSQIKTAISEQIAKGDGATLLHADGWNTSGKPFSLQLLQGAVTPAGGCNPALSSGCKFVVSSAAYDKTSMAGGSCPAKGQIDTAVVTGGQLTAKAPAGKQMMFALPLLSIGLEFPLSNLSLQGQVVGPNGWQSTSSGRLCGVVKKADIMAAIDKIPDAELAALGGKDVVKQIIAGVMKADIDLDGDGTKESVSALIAFTSHAASLVAPTP